MRGNLRHRACLCLSRLFGQAISGPKPCAIGAHFVQPALFRRPCQGAAGTASLPLASLRFIAVRSAFCRRRRPRGADLLHSGWRTAPRCKPCPAPAFRVGFVHSPRALDYTTLHVASRVRFTKKKKGAFFLFRRK